METDLEGHIENWNLNCPEIRHRPLEDCSRGEAQ